MVETQQSCLRIGISEIREQGSGNEEKRRKGRFEMYDDCFLISDI